jgi:hypothetical protein
MSHALLVAQSFPSQLIQRLPEAPNPLYPANLRRSCSLDGLAGNVPLLAKAGRKHSCLLDQTQSEHDSRRLHTMRNVGGARLVSFKPPASQPYVRSSNRDAPVRTLIDGVACLTNRITFAVHTESITSEFLFWSKKSFLSKIAAIGHKLFSSPSPIQMFVDKMRGSSR